MSTSTIPRNMFLRDDRDATLFGRISPDEIALFADADGTLLDLALRPDEARADRQLVDALDRLYDRLGGALAIVSGRRIEDIDRIFDPLRLPASGVHGAEMRIARDGPVVDAGAREISQDLLGVVRAMAANYRGAIVEGKRTAVAVHWRACPQAEAEIYDRLLRILQARGETELAILRGHCVYEIKSADIGKGRAVRRFMDAAPFAGRRPIFVGDDTTDLDGFAAAQALGGQGFAVSTPMAGADATFASPEDVRAFVKRLADKGAQADE
ncbi:MAG: trehalose-phosphatase [Hyphomicrobiales bacterium]|nr:trehalose-phosphatase [Hyphomicrobiales bacterium]